MIEILTESEKDTLAIVISGQLTHEDYEKLRPEMSLRAEQADGFDILVELSDVDGLEMEAIRDDFEFTKEYVDDIERMAVVTDEPVWEKLSTFLGKPLGDMIGIEIEHFDDRSAAWKWLSSD